MTLPTSDDSFALSCLMSGSHDMWPGVRFPDDEYRERHARLRRLMAARSLDVVILTDERTTWYLTGFGTVAPMGSRARPRVLLVTQDAMLMLVHRSTVQTVREMAAPGVEVRGYAELGPPVQDIGATVRALSPDGIAGELGSDLVSGLGFGDWMALSAVVGGRLESVSPLVDQLRAIKSPAELDRIRRAVAVTAGAYEDVLPRLAAGVTEIEVCEAISASMRAQGADGSWANCVIGEYDRVDGVSRRRAAEPGHLVFVDSGANVGGYWADFSRSAVIGHPSPEQVAAQATIVEITAVGVAACRPGADAASIAHVLDGAMAAHGLEFNTTPGRYGHGLGLAVTEAPDLAVDDRTELAAGCVVTIEPAFHRADGVYHCEQIAVVTAGDPEVLTATCPTELRAAG